MDEKLLNLPWEIQIALGSGYAAYVISYVGIRSHHQATDTVFRAIAFGLIATLVLKLIPESYPVWRILIAFGITVGAGLAWRRWGIELWCRFLRAADVSWADDVPSAWATLTTHNSKHMLRQIAVELEDGSWLNCIDNGRFNDASFGPCVLGPTGDVAMFVTDMTAPDGTIKEAEGVSDSDWGDRITYIPAGRIRTVTFRHLRKPSHSPAAAEAPAVPAVP